MFITVNMRLCHYEDINNSIFYVYSTEKLLKMELDGYAPGSDSRLFY